MKRFIPSEYYTTCEDTKEIYFLFKNEGLALLIQYLASKYGTVIEVQCAPESGGQDRGDSLSLQLLSFFERKFDLTSLRKEAAQAKGKEYRKAIILTGTLNLGHTTLILYLTDLEPRKEQIVLLDSKGVCVLLTNRISAEVIKKWPTVKVFSIHEPRQADSWSCTMDALIIGRNTTAKDPTGNYIIPNLVCFFEQNSAMIGKNSYSVTKLPDLLLTTAQIGSFFVAYQNPLTITRSMPGRKETLKQFLARHLDPKTRRRKYLLLKGRRYALKVMLQFYLNQIERDLPDLIPSQRENFVIQAKNFLKTHLGNPEELSQAFHDFVLAFLSKQSEIKKFVPHNYYTIHDGIYVPSENGFRYLVAYTNFKYNTDIQIVNIPSFDTSANLYNSDQAVLFFQHNFHIETLRGRASERKDNEYRQAFLTQRNGLGHVMLIVYLTKHGEERILVLNSVGIYPETIETIKKYIDTSKWGDKIQILAVADSRQEDPWSCYTDGVVLARIMTGEVGSGGYIIPDLMEKVEKRKIPITYRVRTFPSPGTQGQSTTLSLMSLPNHPVYREASIAIKKPGGCYWLKLPPPLLVTCQSSTFLRNHLDAPVLSERVHKGQTLGEFFRRYSDPSTGRANYPLIKGKRNILTMMVQFYVDEIMKQRPLTPEERIRFILGCKQILKEEASEKPEELSEFLFVFAKLFLLSLPKLQNTGIEKTKVDGAAATSEVGTAAAAAAPAPPALGP